MAGTKLPHPCHESFAQSSHSREPRPTFSGRTFATKCLVSMSRRSDEATVQTWRVALDNGRWEKRWRGGFPLAFWDLFDGIMDDTTHALDPEMVEALGLRMPAE
ncbi:hypothetical protein [Mesorhizobium huakuii]|uniref:Uncharacterized protein n=1 Tax=Mesorhizobium huakuii TaxID=28104 RepID=A0A7G6SN08_9HYPH|nr:hypothetical protein [Mesorhizobium huakuii]QND55890.1 hypothetical protein HB778_03900 [Mesorhizobium huakuii]